MRMCVALKTLGGGLPSTHMRSVLRICVALGRSSKAGSRLLLQVVTKVAFHAYAWTFTHMRRSSEFGAMFQQL
ncbi:hypothetical protein PIB30_114470 [Stylosanthes scabra]|uniref:Secreted protein n=1 Tax=Stylosanthes scabra TaxID=79078 RepID=A0ABU6V387_9FABA|nr:hypothetical protein [Stylosanthes scabra]